MKITRVFNDNYYQKKALSLGNCFNLEINNKIFHYEFAINKSKAIIKTDNLEYLEEVIDYFRSYNKYITTFTTIDGNFYKDFDKVYSFKLPINIIQVSTFFLSNDKINELNEYYDEIEIYLPVKIIDDEYVLLDGHHRLYLAHMNYERMVNVYLDDCSDSIVDLLYIAKEHNIRHVDDLKLLDTDEYQNYIQQIEYLK